MKRKIAWLALLTGLALLLGGCKSPLASKLPTDIVISLGLINGESGNGGAIPGATALRAAQGQNFVVPVRINESLGRPLEGTYAVSFALSDDYDPTNNALDVPLGTVDVAAGEETTATLSIAAAVPAGSYNLIAYFAAAAGDPGVAFAADADAYYNVAVRQIDIALAANALPDLTITASALPGAFQAPGSQLPLGFVIENDGYVSLASGTAIAVRISVPSIDDIEIGTQTITLSSALLPQDHITGQIQVTLPSLAQMAADYGVLDQNNLDTWNEDILLTVDPAGAIAESDEANNDDDIPCSSGNKRANVGIDSIILPAGQTVFKQNSSAQGQVAVQLVNYGHVAIDDYSVRLYVDNGATPGTYDDGDSIVQEWSAADTPNLAPTTGGPYYGTVMTSSAASWPNLTGSFDLRAMISGSEGEYAGSDSETEDAASGLFNPDVGISLSPSLVDLTALNMTTTLASMLPAAGGTVPVSLLIQNAGQDNLDTDFSVAFYLSADGTLNPAGDTALGSPVAVTDPMASRGKKIIKADLTVPASANGFYTVYAVVDSSGTVAESNEANNQPANANGLCVYVPVYNGVGTFPARFIAFKPRGSNPDQWQGISFSLANMVTDTWIGGVSGNTIVPGGLYTTYDCTFDPAITYGIEVYRWYSQSYYAFRLVPQYVGTLPESTVPSVSAGQEISEGNADGWDYATPLTGALSPWCNWVTGYIGDNIQGQGRYDYYDYYILDL